METVIFATGGTFDKEYNEIDGSLFFKGTHLREMLEMGRCRLPLRIEVLMMKDSLEMTPEDRKQMLEACRSCEEKHIVITHGTDTMEDSARFLDGQLAGKTVVLTGAMIPYTFGSSDGLFNLGASLSLVQALPPGVYVTMNGSVFRAQEVTKDREKGIFQYRAL